MNHQPMTNTFKNDKQMMYDVKKSLERDNFTTPDTVKEFGLIDAVVENRS